MKVEFLEVVTPDIDAMCQICEAVHGVEFSGPMAEFGNSRVADISNGGRMSIRAPMHADEKPVTRAYMLVDDIDAALQAAEAAGGQTIHPAFEIPGQGIFAICLTGGIEHGFWKV